jgi:hypothetical protein
MDDADATTQIMEGVLPCDANECSTLDTRVLTLARSMLAIDSTARPLAKDVLKNILELL